jgi:hypothetical protein
MFSHLQISLNCRNKVRQSCCADELQTFLPLTFKLEGLQGLMHLDINVCSFTKEPFLSVAGALLKYRTVSVHFTLHALGGGKSALL